MDLAITEMMQEKSKIESEIKDRLNGFCEKYQIFDIDMEISTCRNLGEKAAHVYNVSIGALY